MSQSQSQSTEIDLRRDLDPWPELAPRPAGLKGGVEHTTALRPDVARAWPFVARALASVGVSRGAASLLASKVFELASVTRPASVVSQNEGRRAIAEERLAPLLRRGLPLKLAAAQAQVSPARIRAWCLQDPDFEARLLAYQRQGTAQVHGYVLERAEKGSETAAVRLLEWSGEPEYTPKLRVGRIDDQQVIDSEPYRRLRAAVMGALCEGCRARLTEELGEG